MEFESLDIGKKNYEAEIVRQELKKILVAMMGITEEEFEWRYKYHPMFYRGLHVLASYILKPSKEDNNGKRDI